MCFLCLKKNKKKIASYEMYALFYRLPRKTDMERKIEIVQFASRTRQLFIRLLGLVKWAASASKVEKCAVSIT